MLSVDFTSRGNSVESKSTSPEYGYSLASVFMSSSFITFPIVFSSAENVPIGP